MFSWLGSSTPLALEKSRGEGTCRSMRAAQRGCRDDGAKAGTIAGDGQIMQEIGLVAGLV
jgi:hypothetical protein